MSRGRDGDFSRDQGAPDARSVGYGAQQPSQRVGNADVERGPFRDGVTDTEAFESKIDEACRSRLGIALQIRQADQWCFIEVSLPRIDQSIKMRSRQTVRPDRGGKRLDDDVTADRAVLECRGNALAPPLKPNLAEHRLADRFTHPGNLVIERVEREQCFASPSRSEQCGLEAVTIVTANQSSDSRKTTGVGGTAFPFRRFPVN